MAGEIFITGLIGGILGLDRTAAGQFMISQPIVAGPLVGLALGDWQTGLILGALLELLWMSDLPVGKFVPPDGTMAAVLSSGMCIMAGKTVGGVTPLLMLMAVLVSLPMAHLTQKADTAVRRYNSRFASLTEKNPTEEVLVRYHWKGIGLFFVKSFLLTVVSMGVGAALLEFIGGALVYREDGAMIFLRSLPLIGVSVWLARAGGRNGWPLFAGGFAAAYIAGDLLGVPWPVLLVLVPAVAVAYSFRELRS